MSRDVKSDFDALEQFMSEYRLTSIITETDYRIFISQQHKKYFSYLTMIAELTSFVGKKKYRKNLTIKQFDFIKESCSDIGIAFFYSFHGGYKGSKLLLRSSIETFLKGFCLDEVKNLDKETSIFELFAKVKSSKFFSSPKEKILLEGIHQQYKLLCKDVHTASVLNMASLSSLNFFPSFNKQEAQIISKTLLSLVPNYLSLLAIKYNQQFHIFHFKNRKIITSSIPNDLKPYINKIDD